MKKLTLTMAALFAFSAPAFAQQDPPPPPPPPPQEVPDTNDLGPPPPPPGCFIVGGRVFCWDEPIDDGPLNP